MGAGHSFQQHLDFKDLQTNYTYEKKYSDSRFGEVKLLRENSTGQRIFQKDFSSNASKEFENYVKDITDCTVLAHPNILTIYGYNSKKEDLFCADFYKLSLFFESFESDLEQEIVKRRHTKDYFSEPELWYILDSVASGCAYLQNHNIPHKDIRPFNILITAGKDYKLSPTNIFRQAYNPGYFGNFDDLEARSRYYSPELLRYFSKPEKQRTPYDEYKNDVFALGMTMLEAGLLDKVEGAYNFDKLEVRRPVLQDALAKLGQRYSPNFVKTVESALDFEPTTRLDFIRLDKELGVYRKDIRQQARGITGSPVKQTKEPEHRLAPPTTLPQAPVYASDELDYRVREAVRKSEEVIKRSSPTKYSNKNLDPYIQSYLRNELRPTEQPILNAISPYLTSESKYTTTLTIEQPNYGRESQPINFNQPNARDDLGRGYADLAPSLTGQPIPYTQSVAYNANPSPSKYDQQPNANLGQASFGGYGQPYGQTTYGQPLSYEAPRSYLGDNNYLTQSGITPTVNYATIGDQYGVNSVNATPINNQATESDDLMKRIDERLRQSRMMNQ